MSSTRHAHGPLVRALREARGVSLMELAAAAGMNYGYLSRLERQEGRQASWTMTRKIAAALGIDPAVLTGQIPPYRPLRHAITGWSMEEFAEAIGISPEEYDAIESGRARPDAETRARIAHVLCVSTEALATANEGNPLGKPGQVR